PARPVAGGWEPDGRAVLRADEGEGTVRRGGRRGRAHSRLVGAEWTSIMLGNTRCVMARLVRGGLACQMSPVSRRTMPRATRGAGGQAERGGGEAGKRRPRRRGGGGGPMGPP